MKELYMSRKRTAITFGLAILVASILMTSSIKNVLGAGETIYDDFSGGTYNLKEGQTSPNGKWLEIFSGYGSAGAKVDTTTGKNAFFEQPMAATSSTESHTTLVLSTSKFLSPQFANFKISLDLRTDKQLRQNTAPRAWETAWIMWNFVDSGHHYNFILKTDSAELSKSDDGVGSYAPYIIKSVNTSKATIGKWQHADITQQGNHIMISVNGVQIIDVYDQNQSATLAAGGTIGLYSNNAAVSFGNVNVSPLTSSGTSTYASTTYDDFSSGTYTLKDYQLSPNGKWYSQSAGSIANPGKQGVKASTTTAGNVFFQDTPSPTYSSQSYSTLTLSTASFKNFEMSLDIRTASQTRINSPPNPWEVGWVFWHAVGQGTDPLDRTHFYYFVVKTNGVELGKYDGGTNPAGQKIIANKYYPTETSLNNKIGEWQNWKITVVGSHIVVKVNGATVFDIYDTASFDSGRIGMYDEDARTEFRNVHAAPIC